MGVSTICLLCFVFEDITFLLGAADIPLMRIHYASVYLNMQVPPYSIMLQVQNRKMPAINYAIDYGRSGVLSKQSHFPRSHIDTLDRGHHGLHAYFVLVPIALKVQVRLRYTVKTCIYLHL